MPWSWPCKPWSSACSASWSCEIIISWLQIGPHTHSEWRRAMDHCLTLLCSRQPIPYYSYFYIPPITLILLYRICIPPARLILLTHSYYYLPDLSTTIITQGPAHSLLLTLLFITHNSHTSTNNWYSYHHYYKTQINFLFPQSLIIVSDKSYGPALFLTHTTNNYSLYDY